MTADRYRDVLGHDVDAATEHFVADLDAALAPARLPVQARASVALALSQRAASMPARRGRRSRRWRRPVFILLAALIGLIGGVATAGSGTPTTLVDEAMVYAPGQQQVMQRYGHAVNATARACGYTLQIRRVYADANRVVVLYTVSGPSGRHFISGGSGWPALTNARHIFMEPLDLGVSRDTIESMEGRYVAYDANRITRHARTLHLRMTIPSLDMAEVLGPLGLGMPTSPCETYLPGPTYVLGPSIPVLSSIPLLASLFPSLTHIYRTRTINLRKPLSVNLTIPVDQARRVLTPHRTIIAGGRALTLAHIVVTRSETRVYLQRTTPGHILEGVDLWLHVGGRRYGEGIPLFHDWWQNNAPATRLYDFWFEGPSLSTPGTWRLDVRSDPYLRGYRGFPGGPWTFRFHVP